MTKIKGKLGGFKKNEVDEHIKQIQRTQEAEREDLTEKIETCLREKELLGQELSALTDQNSDFTSVILLELALNNVERVTEYINQTAKEDILAIQESAKQKLLALEDAILVLDKDIQDTKEKIENELKNIIEIANGEEQKKTTEWDDRESLDNKSIGKIYPMADWMKTNKSEQFSEFWGEQQENQPQELIEQMTADGTTKVPIFKQDSKKQPNSQGEPISEKNTLNFGKENGLVLERGNIASEDGETENFVVPETIQDGSYENETNYFAESPSDFWNSGFESEEEPAQSSPEVAVTVDMEQKDLRLNFPDKEELGKVDKPEDFFQTEGDSDAEVLSNPVGNIDLGGENIEREPLPSQAVVRQEIGNARHKYVLGKIAGEDLSDNSGCVIIKKGDEISESVFDIAQKEGKLADLIIHMRLPGQEE